MPLAAAATSPENRPLRVLHVLSVLGQGGMESGVMKLVTGCDPGRVVNDVCSLEPAWAFQNLFSDRSRLHELSRQGAFDLRLVRQLAAVIRGRQIDVVHTHAWGTLVEGWLAARLAGVRNVVHGEHGTMETRPVNIAVQRRVWRRATRLLAVSNELADRMSRVVGIDRKQIQVIPNGVDLPPAFSRDEMRAQLGIDHDTLVALAVGRLVPVKNYRLLLAAARGLADTGRRWRFLIAGNGPLRDELESEISRLGLNNNVTLLGLRHDVPALMQAADAFVLTSSSEGMSNTILEAMAAGRPVVATRVGGNPELVQEGITGMLVNPHGAGELCEALRALAANPARVRRMGNAGRQRVEREFSRERMIANYTQMYESVVRGTCSARTAVAETVGTA